MWFVFEKFILGRMCNACFSLSRKEGRNYLIKEGKPRKFEKVEWEWGEQNNTVTGRVSCSHCHFSFWRAGGGNTENRRERKLLVVFSRSCSFFPFRKDSKKLSLVDGPNILKDLRVEYHNMTNTSNGRAVSHSYIASSSVPTTTGHVSVYKQDRDSSCLDSVHIQRKNIETRHGRL